MIIYSQRAEARPQYILHVMISEEYYYLKAGKASDLTDPKERWLYRVFEIFPGALAWGTLALLALLSWFAPVFIAFFIILFDTYWFLKTVYLSLHLRSSFKKMRENLKINWLEKLRATGYRHQDVYHLVILPMYDEPYEVVKESFASLTKINYPKDKIILTLAIEE